MEPNPRRPVRAPIATLAALLVLSAGCGHGGGDGGDGNPAPGPPSAQREFRAIAGISMGAYGALNLGTKHSELFGTIAALGGPVDLQRLLRDSVEDGLEVKPQLGIPRAVGEDFTFDHLPPYPERDSRIQMLQDLMLAFGNPFLHHPDAARQYLAIDSQPASLLQDDRFGPFTLTPNPRSFLDGGDGNEDGVRQSAEQPTVPVDVALVARDSLPRIAAGAPGTVIGDRALADLDGDGVFDVGDGIVLNYSEPFVDGNANLVFEPELGETFSDVGLDGVADTADFGEGSGAFEYDPDRARWLAEDPLSRLVARPAAEIATQRIYMDVGTRDELGFEPHYTHLVEVLRGKGLTVVEDRDFQGNCVAIPGTDAPYLLVRYEGGHVGFPTVDTDDLFSGDLCGTSIIWQRIRSMIGFLNESFPDGFFGPGGDFEPPDIDLDDLDVDFPDLDPAGDLVEGDLPAPSLAVGGGAAPTLPVLVYRPPAFFHSDEPIPVVYFLGGYGQEPEDFARMRQLLDVFILTGQIQNMAFAFLPGRGGVRGSFYVNHAVPESQAPGVETPTSGRYEDAILLDLIPVIERDILAGRVHSR